MEVYAILFLYGKKWVLGKRGEGRKQMAKNEKWAPRYASFSKGLLIFVPQKNTATLGFALCALIYYFITKSVKVPFTKYSEKII